jgi:hypothetical protein
MKNTYTCFMTALKNGFWFLGILMLTGPAFAQRSFDTDILAETFLVCLVYISSANRIAAVIPLINRGWKPLLRCQ